MTEKERIAYGKRLKELREAADLTQKKLAQKADVNENTITRLEKGKHQMLPETARKLAPILKVDAATLLGL